MSKILFQTGGVNYRYVHFISVKGKIVFLRQFACNGWGHAFFVLPRFFIKYFFFILISLLLNDAVPRHCSSEVYFLMNIDLAMVSILLILYEFKITRYLTTSYLKCFYGGFLGTLNWKKIFQASLPFFFFGRIFCHVIWKIIAACTPTAMFLDFDSTNFYSHIQVAVRYQSADFCQSITIRGFTYSQRM